MNTTCAILAFLSLGFMEICVIGALILILFLGPRLHQSVRGITRMPTEFLRGKREPKNVDAGTSQKTR